MENSNKNVLKLAANDLLGASLTVLPCMIFVRLQLLPKREHCR